MSIQVGGVDLLDSVLNNEFRLAVLEKVIDRLIRVAPPGALTDKDLEKFREEAIREMQHKYPGAGLKKK